jgi:hypothetical protein
MIRAQCFCDGCGKVRTCGEDEPAPRGWFYYHVFDNLTGESGTERATILACSAECRTKIAWTKYRGRKS